MSILSCLCAGHSQSTQVWVVRRAFACSVHRQRGIRAACCAPGLPPRIKCAMKDQDLWGGGWVRGFVGFTGFRQREALADPPRPPQVRG